MKKDYIKEESVKVINKKNTVYDSSTIVEYKYPENVQKKASMYIGELGIPAVTTCIREIFDNSLDEALNGYGSTIEVKINTVDGMVTIKDYGRGMPVDNNAIHRLVAQLHSGGKMDKVAYKTSGGTHGVGSAVVNALSDIFIVQVLRDGKEYRQDFSLGVATTGLIVKPTKAKGSGTTVSFMLSSTLVNISKSPKKWFDLDNITKYYQMQAYLNKGLTIKLVVEDDKEVSTYEFYNPNGIVDYVYDIAGKKNMLGKNIFKCSGYDEATGINYDMALTYANHNNDETVVFCNGIHNIDGGTHLTGLRLGLTNTIGSMLKASSLNKRDKDRSYIGEDYREGLVAIVHIKHPNPIYSTQTKHKLNSTDTQGVVQAAINKHLKEYLEENPKEALIIYNKAIMACRGRTAAQTARDNVLKDLKGKNLYEGLSSISKLSTCLSKNPEECELFIVEGESAGGTATFGRNLDYQAIYKLKGKSLNTFDKNMSEVLNPKSKSYNKEIADLVLSLGCGIGSEFDIKKLRYHKIILLADADVDGLHIQNLLLTFFIKHLPELVTGGYVYIGVPPLYSITKNSKRIYLNNEDEYSTYILASVVANETIYQDETASTKVLTSVKDLRSYLPYKETMDKFMSKYDLDLDILNLIVYAHYMTKINSSEFYKELNEYLPEGLELTRLNNKHYHLEGYHTAYYNLYMDETFFRYLDKVYHDLEANDKLHYVYYDNNYVYTPILIGKLYAKHTPVNRVRLKGLGEMDANELWTTTLDPKVRNIINLEVEDMTDSMDILEILMSNKDKFVAMRRQFLEDNYHLAEDTYDI